MCIFKGFFIYFFLFITVLVVPCIVEFPVHQLPDEILLAVREWKREGMGITSGNGNKTRLNLGV